MSDSKKPAARVSLHPVSAAIWRNENAKGDGAFYSVTLQRSYKDAEGKNLGNLPCIKPPWERLFAVNRGRKLFALFLLRVFSGAKIASR